MTASSSWVVQEALVRLSEYLDQHQQSAEGRTLTTPQIHVLEDLCHHFARNHRQGYIKLPMGSGKSVIFVEIVEALGLPTLVVVPTRLLVDQTIEKFRQFAPGLSVGRMYGEAKESGRQVTVTTYASLVLRLHNGSLDPQQFYLLVLDEAHQCLTEPRMDAAARFSHAAVLGFTATPRYSEEKQVEALLEHEVRRMSIIEATELGMLSSFSVVLAQTQIDLSQVRITVKGDYDRRDLERAINVEARNLAAFELYQSLGQGKRAIIYCVSVRHAETVTKLFNDNGVPAATVSGHLVGHAAREAILRPFREGKIKVVCNAQLLVEGFDDPGVEICMNLRPTTSLVLAEQRGGRALRLDKANPEKMALIIDVIDSKMRPGNTLVSFADVVGTAQVLSARMRHGQSDRGGVSWPIPEVTVEGLTVTTHPEEVLRVLASIKESGSPPPDGWITIPELARKVGRNLTPVKKFVEQVQPRYPNGVKTYVGTPRVLATYVSLEIQEAVIAHYRALTPAPPGWITLSQMPEVIGMSTDFVLKHLPRLIEQQPSMSKEVRRYLDIVNHRGTKFYSPKLQQALLKFTGHYNLVSAPEGWKTDQQWADELGISAITFRKWLDKILERDKSYSAHRGFFANPARQRSSHSSPVLAQAVKQAAIPPEGWLNQKQWAKELGISIWSVVLWVGRLIEQHPELAHLQRDLLGSGKRSRPYYAPELIDRIRERVPVNGKPIKWD